MAQSPVPYAFSERHLVASILLVVAGLVATAPLAAQVPNRQPATDTAPASRPFGGTTAAPISATAVLHGLLVPAPDSGALLAYAVAVRGPVGWYNQETHMTGRKGTDTLPERTQSQAWAVGDRGYSFVFDPLLETLTIQGKTFDLRAGRLIMVTLGATPKEPTTVSQGPPLEFRMRHPEPFAPRFLGAAPQLREFASPQP